MTPPADRDTSRGRRRTRHLLTALPGLVVVGVVLVGLLTAGASAQSNSPPVPGGPQYTTTTLAGGGNATSSGSTEGSGSFALSAKDPITYSLPPSSYIGPGEVLFQQNCSSCHGTDAAGTTRAPNLVGLGAATVDFWVSTGRMPLAISSQQALRKPVRFTRTETLQIVAYVASLSPPSQTYGPSVPTVDLSHANLADGNDLFVLNCAACHTITGAGDSLYEGYFAPSLHKATATQAVEALRTGPGNMPRFGPGTLSDKQLADIVAYVTQAIQHPNNSGGLGLGGIGPVAEGFIGLLVGVGGLMLVAFWIGDRS